MIRPYVITCISKYKPNVPKIMFAQNDTEVNFIEFDMFDDMNVPMTGITYATVDLVRPDNYPITYGSDNVKVVNNIITFTLPLTAVAVNGKYNCSISVFGAGNKRLTMPVFFYNVTLDIVGDLPPDLATPYPVLTSLINQVTTSETSRVGAEISRANAEVLRETTTNVIKSDYTKAIALDATHASLEIINARLGEVDLKTKLQKTDSQLADMAIDVKNPPAPLVGAKGDWNTDDTDAIQKIFNFVSNMPNFTNEIVFSVGIYKVSSSIIIPESFGKCDSINKITGRGAIIKSSSANVDYIFKCTNTTGNPQNIFIDGLAVNGNSLSGGIKYSGVQTWCITKSRFESCKVGLCISDSFYGEVSNEVNFAGCVKAIQLNRGTYCENNTMKFSNIRITSGSVGFELNSLVFDVKIDGCIIEAVSYGVLGFNIDWVDGTNRADSSVLTIKETYFEAITKKAIALCTYKYDANNDVVLYPSSKPIPGGTYAVIPTFTLMGCRFNSASNSNKVTISSGNHFIRNNEQFQLEVLTDGMQQYCSVDTDTYPVSMPMPSEALFDLMYCGSIETINPRYINYGSTGATRTGKIGFLKTVGDSNVQLVTDPVVYGKMGKLKTIKSITASNLTFRDDERRPSGIIMQTPNGSNYMQTLNKDLTLRWNIIYNAGIISDIEGVYMPHELYKAKGGLTINSYSVMGMDSIWATLSELKVDSNNEIVSSAYNSQLDIIRIGTAKRISNQIYPSGNYGIILYDPAIDRYYSPCGSDYIAYAGDYFGFNTVTKDKWIRCIGTKAQMPVLSVDKGTYYATDENKYYEYILANTTWSEITPLFAIV